MPKDLYSILGRLAEIERIVSQRKLEFGDKDAIEYNRLLDSIKNLTPDDIINYHKSVLAEERHNGIRIEEYKNELRKCHNVLGELRKIYSEKANEMAGKIQEIDDLIRW